MVIFIRFALSCIIFTWVRGGGGEGGAVQRRRVARCVALLPRASAGAVAAVPRTATPQRSNPLKDHNGSRQGVAGGRKRLHVPARTLKSTPIVDAIASSKLSSVNRSSIDDFPTPASPMSRILNRWS